MKKFSVVGLMLVAMMAVSAVTIASASGAITFLPAEWLVNGEKVTAKLSATATGEILLEDTNALKAGIKADLLCSGILNETVGAGAGGEITELLSLTGTAIGKTALEGAGLACTNDSNCESAKVWAVNLPWPIEVQLWESPPESGFAILIFGHTVLLAPGWYVECTVLGVKATDECKATTPESKPEGVTLAENETGGVLTEFLESFTELMELKLGLCSSSGEETGIVEGPGLAATTEGTLTISSVTP